MIDDSYPFLSTKVADDWSDLVAGDYSHSSYLRSCKGQFNNDTIYGTVDMKFGLSTEILDGEEKTFLCAGVKNTSQFPINTMQAEVNIHDNNAPDDSMDITDLVTIGQYDEENNKIIMPGERVKIKIREVQGVSSFEVTVKEFYIEPHFDYNEYSALQNNAIYAGNTTSVKSDVELTMGNLMESVYLFDMSLGEFLLKYPSMALAYGEILPCTVAFDKYTLKTDPEYADILRSYENGDSSACRLPLRDYQTRSIQKEKSDNTWEVLFDHSTNGETLESVNYSDTNTITIFSSGVEMISISSIYANSQLTYRIRLVGRTDQQSWVYIPEDIYTNTRCFGKFTYDKFLCDASLSTNGNSSKTTMNISVEEDYDYGTNY